MAELVLVEKQGPIAIVTINRPEALNALNNELLDALATAIAPLSIDETVRCIILTGAGDKAFVAGADIKSMVKMNPLQARQFMAKGHGIMNMVENINKPVIAAINGFALGGGCELAMACDIRYASEKAKMGLPEVGLGIHPGFGGTQRIARLIGKGKAAELLFSANMIGAQEAERVGLVQKVCPHDKLMEEAKALATKIASNGPLAVSLSKAALNRGLATDFGTGLAYEIETCAMLFSTDDLKEGMNAFIEKRKANFQGK